MSDATNETKPDCAASRAGEAGANLTDVLDAADEFELTGRALVDLGMAMQDKNTTIDELAALAFKAGVKLQFRIGD